MSKRRLVSLAVCVNLAIALVAYAMLGWNATGAHVGARWTARFAVLGFLIAYSAPGLGRILSLLPPPTVLVHSYVSAHMVHFAAVAMLIALDPTVPFRHFSLTVVLFIAIGSGVVLAAGVTASSGSLIKRVAHEVFMFAVFAIFFVGYAKHPVRPWRWLAFVLLAVLAVRIAGLLQGSAKASTAAAA